MARNRASVQAAMELLQAALIVGVYLLLIKSLGHMAAVASYAIATLIVAAATIILVARDRRPSSERDGEPEPHPFTL